MSSYTKEINNMTFSFSRLHAYETCPYQFYLTYLEHREQEQNFYAANGSAMHEVMEELLTGKITVDEAPQAYADKFELICETTRQSVMDATYEKCMDYLCSIDPVDTEKYEVLGVEYRLKFKISKYNMTGFVDLLIRNKETGEVILVDHKQATHFMKKDGVTPLKNQMDNFLAYRKQMYIYCNGLQEQHGIKVDKIVWHHFKDDGAITVIPFRQEEMDEAIQWVVNTIEKIKKDKKFEAVRSYLMCRELCGYRNDCEYLEEEEE